MGKLIKFGRAFFAIAMAAFGIQFLIHGLFSLGPGSGPPWTPAHLFWAYFIAIVSVAAAVCIAAKIQVRCAAIVLAVTILLRALLFYFPKLVASPHDPGPWTSGFELLALCGAALVLAGAQTTIKLGRLLFAVPLVVFGVQHFLYAHFIATLIPSWIPGHLFWAYFVGVAFVAAALSIGTHIKAGLAATWLGIMFLLWVLVLHLPRVAAALHNGNEWTSLFVALAMSGGAFLVAGSSSRKTSA
jgi:hypothetical protein